VGDELGQGRREHDDRRREDGRDDARRVDLEGQVRGLPAVHFAPHDALGILHGNPALPRLHEDDGADDGHHEDGQEDDRQNPHLPRRDKPEGVEDALRAPADDAGEDDERDPVADPALRDLLAQPHDEGRAGRERDDRHEAEAPARRDHDGGSRRSRHVLQAHGDAEALDEGQQHRPVARVLGDLAASRLTLLREPLQVRDGDRQQLQDDGGADVGHDPQREDRQVRQRAAREQVEEPQQGPPGLVEERGERRRVDPRRGHVGPDPVDAQEQEREGDPLLELGNFRDVFQSADQVR